MTVGTYRDREDKKSAPRPLLIPGRNRGFGSRLCRAQAKVPGGNIFALFMGEIPLMGMGGMAPVVAATFFFIDSERRTWVSRFGQIDAGGGGAPVQRRTDFRRAERT